MKDLKYRLAKVIDLGRASVETKGAGIVFLDSSGGKRNAAPGCVEE